MSVVLIPEHSSMTTIVPSANCHTTVTLACAHRTWIAIYVHAPSSTKLTRWACMHATLSERHPFRTYAITINQLHRRVTLRQATEPHRERNRSTGKDSCSTVLHVDRLRVEGLGYIAPHHLIMPLHHFSSNQKVRQKQPVKCWGPHCRQNLKMTSLGLFASTTALSYLVACATWP